MSNKTIALSFVEGRVVRDLFENGFLQLLKDASIDVVLYTPAATVPSFRAEWLPHVKAIEYHPLYHVNLKEQRLFKIRDKVKNKLPFLLNTWMKLEYALYEQENTFVESLKKHHCTALLLTHPSHSYEMPVYKAARFLHLPVIGILRSWDNIYKGLRLRPDHLTVWNPVNKEEAMKVMKLDDKQVHITGGSQFDPYFSKEVTESSRSSFAAEFGFNADKPIITIATLGSFVHAYDEHYLIDHLISLIENKELPEGTQLLIRLHPTTKLEYMLRYLQYPFIKISYISGYIPTLGWNMTQQEVKQVGRIMKHSDVVISPGSTITIETAIYNTPTVVPVFHHYQPESGVVIFNYHFKTHFKRLRDEDLAPFVYEKEKLAEVINRCLKDKTYYQEARKKLADDYIHHYDGLSTNRIAKFIINQVEQL